MIDQIKKDFVLYAQDMREKHGAMDDTAPLLWDLSIWLNRRLSDLEAHKSEAE